jgi:hypothetical protein
MPWLRCAGAPADLRNVAGFYSFRHGIAAEYSSRTDVYRDMGACLRVGVLHTEEA